MTIYTKTGDGGDTNAGDGRRVRKTHARVRALGELDELNAHVGLCLQAALAGGDKDVSGALRPVQEELFMVAARIGASPAGSGLALDPFAVTRMEGQIDSAWAKLPELEHFVLPGGCELACRLHVARTVCRRAERAIVALADTGAGVGPEILRYVNRLSDLLFALARLANYNAGSGEQTWARPQ